MLHRTRELLVRQRTMLVNALRGHMAELGIVASQGIARAADLVAVLRVTRASATEPYLSLVLELAPAIIAELALEMRVVPGDSEAPVQVGATNAEVGVR